MNASSRLCPQQLPPSLSQRVDDLCLRFEADWREGRQPRIKDYLGDMEEPGRSALLYHLLGLELDYRRLRNEEPAPQEYLDNFPEHVELVQVIFEEAGRQ